MADVRIDSISCPCRTSCLCHLGRCSTSVVRHRWVRSLKEKVLCVLLRSSLLVAFCWLVEDCATRITVWKKHSTLHTLQHGCGTDTAILRLLNAIKRATKYRINKWIATWDLKAAFDSTPPNLICLVWTRFSVPSEHVEWLTDLDANGPTHIFTAHMISYFHFEPPSVSVVSIMISIFYLTTRLASIYFNDMRDPWKGIEMLKKSLEIDPNDIDAQINMALALNELGMIEDVKCYQYIVEHNSSCVIAYFNLGNAYLDAGSIAEALASFQVLCNTHHTPPPPTHSKAFC